MMIRVVGDGDEQFVKWLTLMSCLDSAVIDDLAQLDGTGVQAEVVGMVARAIRDHNGHFLIVDLDALEVTPIYGIWIAQFDWAMSTGRTIRQVFVDNEVDVLCKVHIHNCHIALVADGAFPSFTHEVSLCLPDGTLNVSECWIQHIGLIEGEIVQVLS